MVEGAISTSNYQPAFATSVQHLFQLGRTVEDGDLDAPAGLEESHCRVNALTIRRASARIRQQHGRHASTLATGHTVHQNSAVHLGPPLVWPQSAP